MAEAFEEEELLEEEEEEEEDDDADDGELFEPGAPADAPPGDTDGPPVSGDNVLEIVNDYASSAPPASSAQQKALAALHSGPSCAALLPYSGSPILRSTLPTPSAEPTSPPSTLPPPLAPNDHLAKAAAVLSAASSARARANPPFAPSCRFWFWSLRQRCRTLSSPQSWRCQRQDPPAGGGRLSAARRGSPHGQRGPRRRTHVYSLYCVLLSAFATDDTKSSVKLCAHSPH